MLESIMSLRIIEISIPHATPYGSLQHAMQLPREIAKAGFNTVFVLPWMKVNRKLSLSPYAVSDYLSMNETLGSLEDARNWINVCHEEGLSVVLDMPLNHTSPSHPWVANDDWYYADERGAKQPPLGTSWNDVFQLNHRQEDVVAACEEVIGFWVDKGADGFRFDAASFIPDDVLNRWISFTARTSGSELHYWCDGEEYGHSRPCFNGFIHHEATAIARNNLSDWERTVIQSSEKAIFYLTNHDTLHAGKCPYDEWPGSYGYMSEFLRKSHKNWLLSWSDWQDPSSRYSFMLEK
jgi:hypothetical protein